VSGAAPALLEAPAMRSARAAAASPGPEVHWFGRLAYEPMWRAMQRYTQERGADAPDQIWLLEHDPVFTLGMNADRVHLLAPGDIPVVQIDRGGQVTYHGPGQLVVYPLIDMRRAALSIRDLLNALERSVIEYVARFGIEAQCRAGAPGVYVQGRKLASVGLRVRRGGSYHGVAFNIDMDLEPFSRINPCGYAGLQMTQLSALGGPGDVAAVAAEFGPLLAARLSR
jgi:lipoyl(octanoyl) transferase